MGDYSAYIPDEGLKKTRKKRKKGKVDAPAWGVEVEGWSMDLHSSRSKVGQAANGERGGRAGISVGLTGDLVERAVREAYTRSLLLDSKTRKAVLVLPEVLPRELVAKVLRVLFEGFAVPGVTVLGSGVASCVGAGVRSGVVCHVGWRECVVSAVYEYRVVREGRSERGYRGVVRGMGKVVEWAGRRGEEGGGWRGVEDVGMTVEEAEEVARRMSWCRRRRWEGEDEVTDMDRQMVEIPSFASSNTESIKVPFGALADVVEDTFFTPSPSHQHQNDKPDDQEPPSHNSSSNASSLSLPTFARYACPASCSRARGPTSLASNSGLWMKYPLSSSNGASIPWRGKRRMSEGDGRGRRRQRGEKQLANHCHQ